MTLYPKNIADLKKMLSVLEDWCELTGMKIHPRKCGWLVVDSCSGATHGRDVEKACRHKGIPVPVHEIPDSIDFFGTELKQARELKLLGWVMTKHGRGEHELRVLKKAHAAAQRLRRMKHVLPETKACLARTSIVSLSHLTHSSAS